MQVLAHNGFKNHHSRERVQKFCQLQGWVHAEVASSLGGKNVKFDKIYYVFPSKLHRRFLEMLFLAQDFPTNHFSTLEILVSTSIKNFQRIQEKFKIGTGGVVRPVEAQYQDEFFRSCWEVLGQKNHLTSEFTPAGLKGTINLFVELMKWGIELTREGCLLEEHIRRFLPKGNYHKWIEKGIMTSYILLDFRTTMPPPISG